MDKVKIGLIGAGGLAVAQHCPSLLEMEDVEFVAISDIDEDKARKAASEFKVSKIYKDYNQMIKEVYLDGIYIVTPPRVTKKVAIDCMKAGKHVLMEKPPGVNIKEAKEILDVALKTNRFAMVAFNRRFCSVLKESVKIVLKNGAITSILSEYNKEHFPTESSYYNTIDSWLMVDVIHHFDTIHWLGGEVEDVFFYTESVGSKIKNVFTILFKFKNKILGVLHANHASASRVERFEIHGKGIAAYIEPPQKATIYKIGEVNPMVLDGPTLAGSEKSYMTYGFFEEGRHFVECIINNKIPDTDIREVIKIIEIITKIDPKVR